MDYHKNCHQRLSEFWSQWTSPGVSEKNAVNGLKQKSQIQEKMTLG
jgi:hypothetical protein